VPDWCEVKPGRQNADDQIRLAIERDRSAYNVYVRTKALPPCFVAHDDSLLRACQILSGSKVPAKKWSDAKRAKEAVAYGCSRYSFRASGRVERQGLGPIDIKCGEDTVELLPINVISVGEVVSVTDWNVFKKRDQPGRVAIGQWLHQGSVYESKYRGAGRDSEGENSNCGKSEAGVPAKLAGSKTNVLENGLEQKSTSRLATRTLLTVLKHALRCRNSRLGAAGRLFEQAARGLVQSEALLNIKCLW
jgi:hypothetical protein